MAVYKEEILKAFDENFNIFGHDTSDSYIRISEHGVISLVDTGCKYVGLDKKLPVIFDSISRTFDCSYKNLETLDGCPRYVGGSFFCNNSNLTSLKHCPRYVGGFNCSHNFLSSLKYGPTVVKGGYSFGNEGLTSLSGIPNSINGHMEVMVYPNMPLLKLLTINGITEFLFWDNDGRIIKGLETIFNKYYEKKNSTLLAGIEMMSIGYGSNARL